MIDQIYEIVNKVGSAYNEHMLGFIDHYDMKNYETK